MFDYETLENTNMETIHKAFVDAFSDYQVKTDLPFWKFQQMLQRRGYEPKLSVGAFKNKELIGFILNGFRNLNGKPTIYDVGTGVIPEYRKQGITTKIFHTVTGILKERNVEQYLLEVLQVNTAAFELYRNQGFEIRRTFSCFRLAKDSYKPQTACKVEHVNGFTAHDWLKLASFWDFEPSWQNSIDSVNAVPDAFVYSVVRGDGNIVGYGVIDRKTGDIPQLAVDKGFRGKGIAGSILSDLINNTESQRIGVINVDDKSEAMKEFLCKSGFDNEVSQYEMILKV